MWLCCGDSITIIVLQPESLKRWFGGFLLQPSFLSRFNQFSSLYQSGLISWSVFVTSLLRKKQDDALGGGSQPLTDRGQRLQDAPHVHRERAHKHDTNMGKT